MHLPNDAHGVFTRLAPPDQGTRAAWFCWFLMGAGLLAPWNAFITATDYFGAMFPTYHPDRLFTLAYLPTCLGVLVTTMVWPSIASARTRIFFAYIGFTVLLAAVPLLDLVMMSGPAPAPVSALVLLLITVAVAGTLDGACQGAVFGEAALMPTRFTQAAVAGTASSGLLICVLRILTKAALSHSPSALRIATAIYFAAGATVTAACTIAYTVVLPRLPITAYYMSKVATGSNILEGSSSESEGDEEQRRQFEDTQANGESDVKYHLASDGKVSSMHIAELKGVVGRTWRLAVTLVLVYVVTLSIFPGFLAEDVHSSTLGDWYPIALITAFNVGDLIGKLAPQPPTRHPHHALPYPPWLPSLLPFLPSHDPPSTLLTATILRALLFMPAFVISDYTMTPAVVVFLLTIALGLSNGYLTASAMTRAPSMMASRGDAVVAEGVMVVSLVLGLTVGALCGWLWLL